MPHDINGKLLKVGDRVTVEFEVTQVFEAELCNLNLKAVNHDHQWYACHANIVTKVE